MSTKIERNGRKTLTTVQGLPTKFDQKKILKVIKKKFACNGTIVADTEMGEVIQLQGDQRKDVQEFLVDKKDGLALDAKTIKVCTTSTPLLRTVESNACRPTGPRLLVLQPAANALSLRWRDHVRRQSLRLRLLASASPGHLVVRLDRLRVQTRAQGQS